MVESVDTLVVGAGQAGIAASAHAMASLTLCWKKTALPKAGERGVGIHLWQMARLGMTVFPVCSSLNPVRRIFHQRKRLQVLWLGSPTHMMHRSVPVLRSTQ